VIRWLWYLALAGLALVTVAAQLDRASQARPELSAAVPGPFRSFAQVPTVLVALTTQDGAVAREQARTLVRRRPMPAEHLFALSVAELRGGDPKAFAATFRAASTRGWRFAPLQVTAARAALDNGDAKGAANRVAALWAAEPDNASLASLTNRLLAAPGGPEALATNLAGTRVWPNTFLVQAPTMSGDDAAIVQTVVAARRAGAAFDCVTLERFSGLMAERGQAIPPGALACG